MRLSVYCVVSLSVAMVSSSPQVQLHRSTVVGRGITGLEVDFFGGIPYVEPPLGPLRLRPPVFKPHLDAGVFNASSFGLPCLQPGMSADLMSEDCLTINIFRPSGATELSSLPGLFWTHSGGYQTGSASSFNGSALVAKSVQRVRAVMRGRFRFIIDAP